MESRECFGLDAVRPESERDREEKRGKAEEAAKEAVGETSGVGGASGLNYTRTGLGEK